ncbi:MAG: O-antigen ligase family protein [Coriobacteriia bacterium]|nr:O-antigen ligase family protein [Coriobacteriia bacterium]
MNKEALSSTITSLEQSSEHHSSWEFFLLLPYSVMLLVAALFVENRSMIMPQVLAFNYAVVDLLALAMLFFALIGSYFVRKKRSLPGIIFLPLSILFCIPSIYFSLQFLLLGGYEERIFGYFGILYPLACFLAFSQFSPQALKRFVRSMVPILCGLMFLSALASVFYANTYYYQAKQSEEQQLAKQSEELQADPSFDQEPTLTEFQIDEAVDAFFAELSRESSGEMDNKVEISEEGEAVQDAIKTVKNYSLKDLFQTPLGGSNYIASILLLFVAAGALLKHRHKAISLLYLAMGGIAVFALQSSGAIVTYLALLLLSLVVHRQAVDSFIEKIFKRSFLAFLSRHKQNLSLGAFVLATILLSYLLVMLISALMYGKSLNFDVLNTLFTNRIAIYQDTLAYFTHQPFLGFGFQFDAFMSKPHNLALSILAYGGLGGLFTYGLLLLGIIVHVIRHKSSYTHAILGIFFIAFVHGLIEPNLLNASYDLYFWALVAPLLVLHLKSTYSPDYTLSLKRALITIKENKLRAVSLVFFGLIVGALSVAGVFTTSHLTSSAVNVSEINRLKLPIEMPDNPDVAYEIRELSERIVAKRWMNDYELVNRVSRESKLNFSPSYPADVYGVAYDYKNEEISLRIISPLSSSELRTKQLDEIQKMLVEDQKIHTPYLEFELKDATSLSKQSTKVYAMKFIMIAVFVFVSLIAMSFREYQRAHRLRVW